MGSLFGSDSEDSEDEEVQSIKPQGLYHFSNLIPIELQTSLVNYLSLNVFKSNLNLNQSMLFPNSKKLPSFLNELLELLPSLLVDLIPQQLYDMLFKDLNECKNQQIIFNLYKPGEGIKSHIDLIERFKDGIIGISLLSQIKMIFINTKNNNQKYSILLKPGDIYILSEEVRYEWLHGIEAVEKDWIEFEEGDEEDEEKVGGKWIKRKLRMSITLRRMKEGANIVGNSNSLEEEEVIGIEENRV